MILLWSCQNDPPLPNSPETVVKQWQDYIDRNDFEKAKKLSTPNAKDWIDWISHLLESENLTEETPSVFKSITCQTQDQTATCICQIEEEQEIYPDTFFLVQNNGQWLVNIPESELQESDMLDSIFQQMIQ